MAHIPRLYQHLYGLLFLCLMFVFPVFASDTDVPPVDMTFFPTMAALNQASPPTADRYGLAQRFYNVMQIPPAPTSPPAYQLGAIEAFTITTTASGHAETFDAELRAIGAHVYVWIEAGVDFVPDEQVIGFARRFDTEIYDQTRALWGSEPIPGIDGDPRLHVLFSTRLRSNVAGFFMAQNNLSRALVPDSNEHEMFNFNLYTYGGVLDNDAFASSAAHEFQHMISNHNDPDEDDWVNEGFSMLTEHLIGLDDNSWAYNSFFAEPETQLNSWGTADIKNNEYGAGMLFMLYFYERYGLEGTQLLSLDTANGLQAVDNTLRTLASTDVENFFADWVVANVIRQPEAGYGYHTLPPNAIPAATRWISVPYTESQQLPQYATHYFKLSTPPPTLMLDITMSDTVPILPVYTAPDDWFWYGIRSNNSNPTLTRAFNLRDVETASLTYRIWYDLEAGWDYGYISVSTDGGFTWQPQSTSLTTESNPNGKAYGVGYSGQSIDWLEDTIVLDAYAGQEILVRFEFITDDATLFTGMAIDDIRLEAIGYHTDANSDDDGWVGNGWIRTDNRLPQRAWIQAVQLMDNEVILARFLIEGDDRITLTDLSENTNLLIAVSPFAPLTLQPTRYTLTVQ